MKKSKLVIATRKSPLAMWQAEFVKAELEKLHPGLVVELLGLSTKGDKILDTPLAKVGGKGLFVKELEQCLLDSNADIAVHSMKDVPFELPETLEISTILEREDPRDAFVSNQYSSLKELPNNAIVGTSSTRRECQLKAIRNDLNIQPLRGNVNTRLSKLDDGQYDAIILASAGLKRLGFRDRISSVIDIDTSLPAIGQGAIGIECRQDDQSTKALLTPLHHQATAIAVTAERAISTALSANCHLPIAAHAHHHDELINLDALVGLPDGTKIIRSHSSGKLADIAIVTEHVINDLVNQGAYELVDSLRENS